MDDRDMSVSGLMARWLYGDRSHAGADCLHVGEKYMIANMGKAGMAVAQKVQVVAMITETLSVRNQFDETLASALSKAQIDDLALSIITQAAVCDGRE
jgi:hypothetical protein